MNKVFYDIETTGFSFKDTDRIVEIAGIEYTPDGIPTGREFYSLVDPGRRIPAETVAIHGITDAKVAGQPKFKDIVHGFLDFIEGTEAIAHNGKSFDEPFINAEMSRAGVPFTFWEKPAKTTDSLHIAKQIWPKQKVSMDAILDRLGIDRSERVSVGHNARLDCRLLAKAFFAMTAGFDLQQFADANHELDIPRPPIRRLEAMNLPQVVISAADRSAHETLLDALDARLGQPCIARSHGSTPSPLRPR